MPSSPLSNRFKARIRELTTQAPSPSEKLGIAVSGGPDSLALLHLAASAWPDAVAAATVDHGLRPEAADEARHVAAICKSLAIPHQILAPEQPIAGNIQSSARTARYALLDKWREQEQLGWIATAHHADDQLETVLMRLLRGSGVDGLSAVRPINGYLIRPLLDVRKTELVAYAEEAGLEFVDDPSNEDEAFDRVRLRKALTGFPGFDASLLERSVGAARDASEALNWVCEREAEAHVHDDGDAVVLTRTDYPAELLRRLVLTCLGRLDPDHSNRGQAIESVIQALSEKKTVTIGKILCSGKSSENWRFSMAPPRKTG